MEQEYYLGLDMGTGSLGWAITDDNYQILRKHGKTLWGVRLFETANTAEERRIFRTNRRRLDRQGWRIQILQELFAKEISKVDPGFYLRMKESRYWPEDKRDASGRCPEFPYALFVDPQYTDKEYHKEFPTIYHLRKMLMETDQTPDIRLVYLAIHHMMKHRGHFLLSGDISQVTEFRSTFLQFVTNVQNEELDFHLRIGEEEISSVENTLKDQKQTRTLRKKKLVQELKPNTKCEKALLTLLSGGTAKLSDIFDNEELDESEKPKLSFSDSGYEEYIGSIEVELGEQYYIIESAKAVYDWAVLKDILGENESVSAAKVQSYEKHNEDLEYLKEIVKKYLSQTEYKQIFVESDDKLCNYCAYIGMTRKNGRKVDLQGKRCSREAFMDFLKKNVIPKIDNEEVCNYLSDEIEKDTFLPRQVTKDNGVIPYQIHLFELRKILDNLGNKMPFIKENADKIIQLFTFRIPYYVGPLGKNNQGSGAKFSWAVRKDDKIYPWNFNEVVDVETSEKNFIRRMTNKCTYLYREDVLPKDSILYSKYMVLNELNNLKLDGQAISVELKQRIYNELFCKSRKVTRKKLISFLVCEGICEKNVEVGGIDGDFKSSLNSYHDFKEKLTGVELTQREKEEIILNIVLFGDDKKLLKKRIGKCFPNLTEKQLSSIAGLSYKGWGRFSKKFLEEITIPAPQTGEVWNIITALWETNDNLMQILYGNYGFQEEMERINEGKYQTGFSYKEIEESYVSPAVKRQIWQTIQVVKELQKVMKADPKRVFIEMAREKQESIRTESRKKRLLDLYRACKKEEPEWIDELTDNLQKLDESQLRKDKLYLYYTQKGRCMYSGEKIELDDLWDNTKYDIDHIYPQSKTMDDSLDNRVLVKKELNEQKEDNYPINPDIQNKRNVFWKSLLKSDLISKEKYNRLMRTEELSADELAGFINRQLVETRQSTKVVAEILKKVMPKTEIVYVKAPNVSHFRHTFNLIKVRELNDLHHAKDAYLNIVVGNSYFVKFTKDAAWYIRENPGRSYNLKKLFDYDIQRKGECAWKAGEKGTITQVKNTMHKNTILVTRKSYENKGGLFDQQIMKKGKGQIPIKSSDERLADIEKYGGYNKAAGAYFMLVRSKDKKGNEQRTIEYVPIYLKSYVEKSQENALEYLKNYRQLKEPEILLQKIKIDTLIRVDGFYMWLSGRTNGRILIKNANELLVPESYMMLLKKIIKFVQRMQIQKNKDLKITVWDKICEDELIQLYDYIGHKLQNTIYQKLLGKQGKIVVGGRDNFLKLSIENKCVLLNEMLHLFQCQSCTADLRSIGGSREAGKLSINANIGQYSDVVIINQSITGIYEKTIDLLKL